MGSYSAVDMSACSGTVSILINIYFVLKSYMFVSYFLLNLETSVATGEDYNQGALS